MNTAPDSEPMVSSPRAPSPDRPGGFGPGVRLLVGLAVLSVCLPARATEGSVRAFGLCERSVWAVGDAGLILRSDDDGRTWREVPCPPSAAGGGRGPAADFTAVGFADAKDGWIFGARVLGGHPGGASVGVVLRTTDGGRSWTPVGGAGLGGLFGGRLEGVRGVAFGMPTWRCPSGVWMTVTAGRLWVPVATTSRGMLAGGAFADVNLAYLVGPDHRIVSLRRLAEPPIRPGAIESSADLTAICRLGEEDFWAVGENGSVLASVAGARPWRPVTLPLPAGTRRLADLEAIASDGSGHVALGGGLVGVVFQAGADGRLVALPAPAPGPVRALVYTAAGTLLAGGDGGRIWRREQDGWRLVRGRESVDVLFIAAPADVSIFPAAAAHALAGAEVAILHASAVEPVGPAGGRVRGDVFARSAGRAVGAAGVMVLGDFPSVVADPQARDLDHAGILARWSKALDRPARAEMVRQMAAAIRLYRPAVVAVGPQRYGTSGPAGENHLVSILASEAVGRAGDESALPELARVGLKPWRPKRVFVGLDANERYLPPWKPRPHPREAAAVRFLGWRYPVGADTCLTMLAMRGAWLLPWIGPEDRPAEVTRYRCFEPVGPRGLFTSGLSPARLRLRARAPIGEHLADGSRFRGAVVMRQNPAVLSGALLTAAREHPTDPLAVDLLARLLRWHLERGDLAAAGGLWRVLLPRCGVHPLGQRLEFAATALWLSREWGRLEVTSRLGGAGGMGAGAGPLPAGTDPRRLVRRMTSWPLRAWIEDEPGRVLLARLLARCGDFEGARKVYRDLAATTSRPAWRTFAAVELAAMESAAAAVARGDGLAAGASGSPLRVDARLDEQPWKTATRVRLVAAGGSGDAAAGHVRLLGTPSHLGVAIRLVPTGSPVRAIAGWDLTVALDLDRDVWTQLLLRCDSGGRRRLRLKTRWGPEAAVRAGVLPIQARPDGGGWTIELAVPRELLAAGAGRACLLRMDIRASVRTRETSCVLRLARDGDDRLLPHRYTLVAVPPATRKPTGAGGE